MIQVMDGRELSEAVQENRELYPNCISVVGHGEHLPPIARGRFRRVLEISLPVLPGSFEETGPSEQVRAVIDFVGEDAAGYLIHGGKERSQSAAVALGVAYLLTRSEQHARALLEKAAPGAMPMRRVVGMFDQALGSRLLKVNEQIRGASIDAMRQELAGALSCRAGAR